MPVNKKLKLWCKDDMVRAIGMVHDGVPIREAADTCNVPRTTLTCRWHIEKGDYTVNYMIMTRLFINNNHVSIMNQLCTESVYNVYHFINHSCIVLYMYKCI